MNEKIPTNSIETTTAEAPAVETETTQESGKQNPALAPLVQEYERTKYLKALTSRSVDSYTYDKYENRIAEIQEEVRKIAVEQGLDVSAELKNVGIKNTEAGQEKAPQLSGKKNPELASLIQEYKRTKLLKALTSRSMDSYTYDKYANRIEEIRAEVRKISNEQGLNLAVELANVGVKKNEAQDVRADLDKIYETAPPPGKTIEFRPTYAAPATPAEEGISIREKTIALPKARGGLFRRFFGRRAA